MPKLRLDGDASGAIKAVTDLHKAQAALVKEGGNAEKQATRMGRELSAAAKRAQTDWQKYNGEVARYAELVKRGTISQKEAEAATQKYYQTVFKGAIAEKQAAKDAIAARHADAKAAALASQQNKSRIDAAIRFHGFAKAERAALEARKVAMKETADATAKATAEQEKLVTAAKKMVEAGEKPAERYARNMGVLNKAFKFGTISQAEFTKGSKHLKEEFERVENQGKKTFGQVGVDQLKRYALGLASVTAAVALIKRGIGEVEKAGQTAADNIRASTGAMGEIQQLPADVQQKVVGYGDSLISKGIIAPSSREMAYDIAFNLESAGYTEAEKDQFARVAAKKFVRPQNLLEFGSQLKKIQEVYGQRESGSLAEILDKTINTASAVAGSASDVASAVPVFGSLASSLGISDEESLAGLAGIEKQSKNTAEAATRFRAFLSRASKDKLIKNNDLTESVTAINARVAAGEDINKIFPDVDALAGYQALANQLPFVEKMEKSNFKASGLFERQTQDFAKNNLEFALSNAVDREQGKLDESRKGMAKGELAFDAAVAVRTMQLERQYGWLGTAAAGIGAPILDAVGQDWFIRSVAGKESFKQDASPESMAAIEQYLGELVTLTKETRDAIVNSANKKPVAVGRQR